jgi:ribonuclease P protein component
MSTKGSHQAGAGLASGSEIESRSGMAGPSLLSSAPVYTELSPAAGRLGRPPTGPRSGLAKEFEHQENVSAQEALPEEGARVPGPYVDPWRGSRPQAPPPQGAPAPDTRARAVKTKYRLRRSADFRAVTAERRSAGDEILRVRTRPNSVGHPRVGIVVPKRLGGAVERNRLRRRLQAAMAGRIPSLGGFDLVLLPRAAASTTGAMALGESLSQTLGQTGTLL